MISNDTKFGYEKILGLRGDRTKKRSLEARADAFLRLKNVGMLSQKIFLPIAQWVCFKMWDIITEHHLTTVHVIFANFLLTFEKLNSFFP